MDQFDDKSFELAQERIAALEEVEVYGEKQLEALQVAARAIEAHAGGPEAWDAFVKEQKENRISLKDVSMQLWMLPKDQPEETCSVIYFAKLIVMDESYKKVLECSSRGDQRFSPEFAKVKINGIERSISDIYQDAKKIVDYVPGRYGKKVARIEDPFTGDKLSASEAAWLYRGLWMTYFNQNPDLVKYAEQFDGFSNINSKESLEGRYNEIIEAYVKGDRERYVAVVKCSDWYKNMERQLVQPSLDYQIKVAKEQVVEEIVFPDNKRGLDR